jgi:hypothetical protein
LTLLTKKLNSKVSNGPWLGSDGKRRGLEANDVLMLNRHLLEKAGEEWTDDAIQARTQELVRLVTQIWPVTPNHKSGVTTARPRLRKKIDLLDLITGGALEPGMALFPRRQKYSHRVATLLPDGRVEVDGMAFSSPSDAASAITGKRTSGSYASVWCHPPRDAGDFDDRCLPVRFPALQDLWRAAFELAAAFC